MSRTTISIGPKDQGRRMPLDDFATAEAAEGHIYELGRGAVVVVDVPGRGHLAALGALKRQIHGFDVNHPGIIHTIASGGECKILVADLDSERHPDLAIYKTPPGDDDDFWSTWIPEIVVEVVSRGSIHRDYVEKREEYLRFGIKEYRIVDAFRQKSWFSVVIEADGRSASSIRPTSTEPGSYPGSNSPAGRSFVRALKVNGIREEASMATIEKVRPRIGGDRYITLQGISWTTYKLLVDELGDQAIRMTYNQGTLEFMSPGPIHEHAGKRLGFVVEVVTEELGLPCTSMRSTRWERSEAMRGLEADGCYYLSAEKVAASWSTSNNSADYPTPDLAIEVDLRAVASDREEVYASIGIPEVIVFDGEDVRFLGLGLDGTYEEHPTSRFLPIRPDEVLRWLVVEDLPDDNAWKRAFRAWVRAELADRPRMG